MILIYTTHKSATDAAKLVKHLLERQLIACANTYPITAAYRWKGKIKTEKEVVTLLKTRESLWSSVHDEIQKVHPYDTPCILKVGVEANTAFAAWVNQETLNPILGVAATKVAAKKR